jgi:hypothetical protein
MRDGGGYPPRRHRHHLEPGRRRPRDRQDRRHRIRKRRPRRPRQPRINHQPTQQLREPRPHHIDPAGEPAQPPPHRLPWTTQALRDPACSHTGRLRRQRRPHHLHRIRPPQQHLSRQQHMRRPAAGTPAPARTQPPPASQIPHPPTAGIPPPPQPCPPTTRAVQLTRHQLPLDLRLVNAYGKHQVPPCTVTAALPNLAKGSREGRGLSEPPHGDGEHEERQPTRVALNRSSPPVTPTSSSSVTANRCPRR